MNRFQLERIYEAHGIQDYKLHSLNELVAVHGVDITAVKGYPNLSSENQELFSKFILHFYNAYGKRRRTHQYNYLENNKNNRVIEKSDPLYYLRFQLKSCDHKEWYHIRSEIEWY